MTPAIESTVGVVLAAKAVRTFCYGYLGILIPLHLAALGLDARGIGLAVTLTLGASALLTLLARRPAERLGSRAVLVALAALVMAAGVLLATARGPALVVLAAMIGNVAVSTGETGPFLSIEQVLIARAAAGRDLTLRMSLYNLVGYVAAGLGALTVAALPHAGAAGPDGSALLFWLFALSGGVQALLYARLPDVPVRPAAAGARRRPSRRFIYRIAALFALDSFAGGFVLQSLLVYWLHTPLRARAGRDRRGVLRGPAAHGVLPPPGGLGRAADRAREHDGVLPPRSRTCCSSRWGSRRRRGSR